MSMAVARIPAVAIAPIMLVVAVLGEVILLAADELFNRAARTPSDGRRGHRRRNRGHARPPEGRRRPQRHAPCGSEGVSGYKSGGLVGMAVLKKEAKVRG